VEGKRLLHCVKMHKRLFGVDVKKIGGDTGYEGSDNRGFCKENGVRTSFVKRGRPAAEIMHIIFGIHTVNVVRFANRIAEQQKQTDAA
jgi:hypothetical protein